MASKEQVLRAFEITTLVAGVIHDLGRIPSGHLYARLMGRITYEDYQAIISTLKRAKLVREQTHELIWCGAKLEGRLVAAEKDGPARGLEVD